MSFSAGYHHSYPYFTGLFKEWGNKVVLELNILIGFRFPKDPELRKRWVVATKRKGFIPSNSSRLCSAHFEDSAFEIGGIIKLLKKDAVPTLFDFPAHLQPNPPKRRRVISKIKVILF